MMFWPIKEKEIKRESNQYQTQVKKTNLQISYKPENYHESKTARGPSFYDNEMRKTHICVAFLRLSPANITKGRKQDFN